MRSSSTFESGGVTMTGNDAVGILFIGHGSIAAYAAKQIRQTPRMTVHSALCRPGRDSAARAVFGENVETGTRFGDLSRQATVAVDCAGHDALRAHGPAILGAGVDLLTISNGALSDPDLLDTLRDAAIRGGAKLKFLSGAIGAIDAIAAAAVGGLHSVRYTGRKPPMGWVGSPAEERLDLQSLTEPTVHFKGSAREAAKRYPKNANVAATIALAGLGFDKTEARLIADPTITTNQHQIEASGAFGTLSFTIDGHALPDNPRSSALTAMSVVKALNDYAEPIIT